MILHLLRPLRSRFLGLWVNSGALPHEADHIRRETSDGPFLELDGGRDAVWRDHGLPSLLAPAGFGDMPGTDAPADGVKVQPMPLCCARVRSVPSDTFLATHGFTLEIHGQRRGEGTAAFLAGGRPLGSWSPLARWTRAQVMERVAHHGVPLPIQYREGFPETVECGVCPANLDPGRLAFLRNRYPDAHGETLRLARLAFGRVNAIRAGIAEALRKAEASAAA